VITVEIIDKMLDDAGFWMCWLEITSNSTSWYLPAAAPGDLEAGDLQAHFNAQANYLWQLADGGKGFAPNILLWPRERRLIRAFAEVVKDEVNILRAYHSLPDRTLAQLKAAIKAKLKELDGD
jgi:hypothetical protein